MTLQLSGRIIQIGDAEQKTDKLLIQEFVLETQGQYPQQVAFQVINKSDLLSSFKSGDTVTVSFDVRGREYQGRYYTSLNAWKVEYVN